LILKLRCKDKQVLEILPTFVEIFLNLYSFMLIYNITFLVADKVSQQWLQWVNDSHIPEMVASGYFTEPRLAKVLSDHGQEGTSYAVQYHIADMQELGVWRRKFGSAMERNCASLFGEDVLLFTTVLELIK
jgi:hypothetical protein